MRMARVNVTIPDELVARARAAGLNISSVASAALAEELDRRAKVVALDRYLAEMESELGPVAATEQAAAERWVDGLLRDMPQSGSDPLRHTA